MKFTLLTNGIDSLKASYERIEKINQLIEGVDHNIKDAIMYLNHANEILFKLILKNQKEYLMFEDISAYMKAKDAIIQQHKSNVFDISPKLRTVNFSEAIKRIQFLCDIEMSPKFKGSLEYLNKKRNELMHFEIEMSPEDVGVLVSKLKVCHNLSVDFFKGHLEDIEEMLESVRFEQTIDEYYEDMAIYQAEMDYEDARMQYMEGAYEDLGEGKW